jgi:hypothetical protein
VVQQIYAYLLNQFQYKPTLLWIRLALGSGTAFFCKTWSESVKVSDQWLSGSTTLVKIILRKLAYFRVLVLWRWPIRVWSFGWTLRQTIFCCFAHFWIRFPRKWFLLSTKLYTNLVEISMFRFSEISVRCQNRNFDFDYGFDFDCLLSTKSKFQRNSILISSTFRYRNWNFDFSFEVKIGILLLISIWKVFFTEISQKIFFDCLSEFRFRPSKSKSKFRLLLIISTNNFFESLNSFRSEFRSEFRRN